ncbi:hypothetical protein D3C77_388640 [compost metagenome]
MTIALAVAVVAHKGDQIISLLIYVVIFAMMFAIHGFHAFREPDEADGQTAMLKQFSNRCIGMKLLAAFPYAFPHHKVRGLRLLGRLNLEAVQQPVQSDIHITLQLAVEALFICDFSLS